MSLKAIGQNEPIGEGERLIQIKAKNATLAKVFETITRANFLSSQSWDKGFIPLVQRELSKNGFKVTLPQGVNANLHKGKFRTRKWYDPKTQTLFFWANFKKVS